MGQQITGIFVNALPSFMERSLHEAKTKKTKFEKIKIENFSPELLTIGFKDNSTFIFLDKLLFHNMSEKKELTPLEKNLVYLFPDSKIISSLINDTIDFVGYSILEKGIKKRTKAIVRNEIFLDYGNLLQLEIENYKKVSDFIDNCTKRKISNFRKIFSEHSEIDFMKEILLVADSIMQEYSITTIDKYEDGSLDIKIIDNEIQTTFGNDIYGFLGTECLQFQQKRISFKTGSLEDFIRIAHEELN